MPYESLNLGINLTLPTSGTTNWGQTLKQTTWTKISEHEHTGSGDGNQLVTASYSDFSVTIDKLAKNAGSYQYDTPLVPAPPFGGSQTVDFANGSIQTLDLGLADANVTLTLSNPAKGATYKIWVIQGAIPRDLIFPGNVKWPQGQAPILTQTDDAIDLIELYYNGTDFLGQWQNNWS